MYRITVAGDMLLLALKAYRHGNLQASARLFVAAASSSDSKLFETQLSTLSSSAEAEDFGNVSVEDDKTSVLAFHEELSFAEVTEGDEAELRAAIKFARSESSEDEAETISISDDEEQEEEIEIENEDVPDFTPIVEHSETEISSADITAEIRKKLLEIKGKANNSNVQRNLPLLMAIFPDMLQVTASESNDLAVRSTVVSILNKLKMLSSAEATSLLPVVEKILE